MTSMLSDDRTQFEPHCLAAFEDLRVALLELYHNVGADPETPQDIARRFKVNKTLTWNVSKVMSATEPLATVPNVPGGSALRVLLDAMLREGASQAAVQRVRLASEAFDKMIATHVGDRATLELVLDGMGTDRDDYLEHSRKLAFRGNSGLWGIQAKTRLMSVFMAPNPTTPQRLDIAIVRGYVGVRRLRTDVRWPLFQLRGWGDRNDAVTKDRWEPIEESAAGQSPSPVIRSFSTFDSTKLEEVRTPAGLDFVLTSGPVGNAGSFDCFLADYARSAVSTFRTATDITGEFGAPISAPTERLVFDIIVDEQLDFALSPEVRAYGGVFAGGPEGDAPGSPLPLPLAQSIVALPGRPPLVATASVPRYADIVSLVFQRMGWDPVRFRGCRYELAYPPLGSTVLMSFGLPAAPEASR
ncbi:MAG: hypothetical protein U0572_03885 [Phycisphaerales bacterium]